jgi:hypothetical protein
LKSKIEEVSGEDQLRFQKGKGPRNTFGFMRTISENVLDIKEETCL